MTRDEMRRYYTPASLVLSLIIVFLPILRFAPEVSRRHVFNDDNQIYTWIFHKARTPDVFPDDPIYTYIHDGLMTPTYRWYNEFLAGHGVHPVDVTNYTSFLLMFILGVSVWFIAKRLFGPWWAVFFVTLFFSAPTPPNMTWGANSRSIGYALVFVTIALWLSPKRGVQWLAAVSLSVQALFYPIGMAMTLSVLGLRFLVELIRKRFNPLKIAGLWFFVFFFALHIGFFAYSYLVLNSNNPYGEIMKWQDANNDPHWTGDNPRYVFYPVKAKALNDIAFFGWYQSSPRPMAYLMKRFNTYVGTAMAGAIFFVVLICVWIALRNKSAIGQSLKENSAALWNTAPELLLLLPFMAPVYFFTAAVAFRMYVPGRHLMFAFPLLVNIFVLVLFKVLVDAANIDGARMLKKVLVAVLAVWVGATLVSNLATDDPKRFGMSRHLSPEQVTIYEFVETLPPDSMIFTPDKEIGDGIPLLCGRSVLWNYETHQILHAEWATFMDERVEQGVNFLLHGDASGLRSRNVTHVVLNKNVHAPGMPFDRGFLVSPLYDKYSSEDLRYDYDISNVVYEDDTWVVMKID